jgi:DNA polymerase I-like protein with 3'-5' exonuclease and polymerase domains
LIQGSAADQTKQAIVTCAEKGFTPLLQIHDELCFNISDDDDISKIKSAMEGCVKLKVPSVVDVATGKDFGEAT